MIAFSLITNWHLRWLEEFILLLLRPFVNASHPRQLACPLHVTSLRDPCIWPHPVTPAFDLTPWPLHLTSPRDSCTWPLCSSTQFVELNQLNTSSRFRRKHNFFEVPKIRSVSTWHITWLLLFTLSIPLDQTSVFTRLIVLQMAMMRMSLIIIKIRFVCF